MPRKKYKEVVVRKPNLPIAIVKEIYEGNDLKNSILKIMKENGILDYIKAINPNLYAHYTHESDLKKSKNY